MHSNFGAGIEVVDYTGQQKGSTTDCADGTDAID
jgi:hypothetical protein